MSFNEAASELIQSKLTCPICQNTCVEPYILGSCNHVYCWGCINGIKESGHKHVKCPSCRSRSKLPKFYNNNPINEILSNIKSEDYEDLKKDYFEDKHFREQLRLYQKTKKYEKARKFVLETIINDECIHYDDFKKMPQVVDEMTLNIILSSTKIWNQIILVKNFVLFNDHGCISDFMTRHDLDEKSTNCLLHHYLEMESVENVGQVEDLSPLYAKIYMYTEKKRKFILKHFKEHPFGPVSDDEESDSSECSNTGEYESSGQSEEEEEDEEEEESENQDNQEVVENEDQDDEQASEEQEEVESEESSENQEEESEESSENQEEEESDENENQEDQEERDRPFTNDDVEMMRERAHNLTFMYHNGDLCDTDDNILQKRAKLSKDVKQSIQEMQVLYIQESLGIISSDDLMDPDQAINEIASRVYRRYRRLLFGPDLECFMMKSILTFWNPKDVSVQNYNKLSEVIKFQLLYSFVRLMRYEIGSSPGDISFSKEFLPMLEEFEQKIKSKLDPKTNNTKLDLDPISNDDDDDPSSTWKARMTF